MVPEQYAVPIVPDPSSFFREVDPDTLPRGRMNAGATNVYFDYYVSRQMIICTPSFLV